MLKRLVVITGLMFLASTSWAQVLDKASSFKVEHDAIAGTWTLECSSEVSGIDRSLNHHVGADLRISGGTSSIQIFNATLNILADENRIVRTLDRVDYEIKKAGTRLKVSIVVADYFPAGTGDTFTCTININEGTTPGDEGDSLSAVQMRHAIQNAGTP